jgi:hypothetical protein
MLELGSDTGQNKSFLYDMLGIKHAEPRADRVRSLFLPLMSSLSLFLNHVFTE